MPTQRKDVTDKKPYATPELIVHGTVEEITQQLAGGGYDSPFGSVEPF